MANLANKHVYLSLILPRSSVQTELLLANITTYCIVLFEELN